MYARLAVRLEERGESFYNPMLPGLVQELMAQGIAEESEGAKVIFVKVIAHSIIPLLCSDSVCFEPKQTAWLQHMRWKLMAAALTSPCCWCHLNGTGSTFQLAYIPCDTW